MLIRSSCGDSRRSATIGEMILTISSRLAEGFADVEGLLEGDAEAPGDGQDRNGGTELDVELRPSLALEAVDQEIGPSPRSSS